MPTFKQKKAFEKVVKGSSLTQAMKDVGYSESTSKRTNKLTKTDGWNELLNKHISDVKLTKVLNEGLEAGKTIYKNEEEIYEPDFAVRHKYLETGLKLKGHYNSEDIEKPKENVYNFFFEPQFQQNIRSYDENLKNLILNKDETNKES